MQPNAHALVHSLHRAGGTLIDVKDIHVCGNPCNSSSMPPVPQPCCTRRERRTRAKGSGVFAAAPSVPLTRRLRSSRGRKRSPLPLIPWRHHNSRSGEAQSEKGGWAMASWCRCPACCAGHRSLPTPLGLAWGGEPSRPSLHRLLARGPGTAVCRGLAEVPLPPPTLAGLPSCTSAPPPPRGVDAPILVVAAMPLWPPLPLPVPGRRRRRGHEATDTGLAYAPVSQAHGHHHSTHCCALLHCSADQFSGHSGRRRGAGSAAAPSWNGGIKSGEGAGRPLLGSRSGSRVAGRGGGRRDPLAVTPPLRPWLPCGDSAGAGPRPRGPPPTLAFCPCPALSSCLALGPPAKGLTPRPGPPAHSAAAASHACLWLRGPAPPAAASACPVA